MARRRRLAEIPELGMEVRVARLLGRLVTRHERWKTRRFGVLVAPATILAGLALLIVGIIALPAPGPGWLLIFTALGVLSLELRRTRGLVLLAARGFDRIEAWFRRRHPAVQLTLGGLTTALTMAVIAGSWWLLAPAGWPLTRG